MPYIGDNILIVADGLGGSGSAIHAIDRQKHTDIYGEIWSYVFYNITDPTVGFRQYANELIAPLLDNQDDTSALWASRIAIARCVYALTDGEFQNIDLNDDKQRAKLAEFITEGLDNAVINFDLQKGKYDNQLLLPTTLAFIRYAEQEQSVVAETVWAGDSRCYALLPEGLKLLSVDDEDNSGAITNLFYAGNSDVRLNYLRHELKKPCILMAVSDGVFDPFDPHAHLGLEHIILSTIAESDSEEELSKKLKAVFDDFHSDDATMAFVALGFSDFAELKKTLKPRADYILSVIQTQAELQLALEAASLPEDEVAHYVTSRATDRFEYIVPMLLDAYESNSDDIAITDEIRNTADTVRKKQIAEIEQEQAVARKQTLESLNQFVKENPKYVKTNIFNKETTLPYIKEFSDAVSKFKRIVQKLDELYQSETKYNAIANGLEERKKTLHNRISHKIKSYKQEFEKLVKKNVSGEKSRCDYLRLALDALNRLEKSIRLNQKDKNIDLGSLKEEEQELLYDVNDYVHDRLNQISNSKKCSKKIKESEFKYLLAWDKLFQWILDIPKGELILSDEIRQRFGLAATSTEAAIRLDEKDIRNRVMHALREQKSAVVANIVGALAENYDKTSVIDFQFNAGRLLRFRTYYKLKFQPDNRVGAFDELLCELENGYADMVKQCKE